MRSISKLRDLAWACVAAGAISLSAQADDNLHINGFLTAGVTGSDMKSLPTCPSTGPLGSMAPSPSCTLVTSPSNPLQYTPYYDHIQHSTNWTNDSILGLQAAYTIDSQTSMTAQLVSYGIQNYQVNTIWAYATYKPSDSTELRLGRQRIPFYMLSEQIDVGMSYPWARPPLEMYSLPVNQYDGLSGRWNWQWGDTSGNFNFLVGNAPTTSNSPYIPLGFDIKDARGFNFNIYQGNFTFHGGVTAGNTNLNLADDKTPGQMFYNLNQLLTAVGAPSIADQLATFYDLGAIYDDGNWLVMSEISDLRYGNGSILQDPFSGYVMVGYHFGQLMPEFTVSQTRTNTQGNQNRAAAVADVSNPANLAKIAALAPAGQSLGASLNSLNVAEASIANQGMQETTYTLGLRYDLTPKMSVKVEWSHITGLGGSPDGVIGSGGWGMFSDAPVGGNANLYTFVVNAMF